MPPVSQPISASPFVTTALDADSVVIQGQRFRVIKLGSATEQDLIREERKTRDRKKPKSINAFLKTVSPQTKDDYRLGVKISKLPQNIAERVVKASVTKAKEAALREKLELNHLHVKTKRAHAAELVVTAMDVSDEIDRLRVVVSAVEGAVGFED